MKEIVNIYAAKTHLSRLVDRARDGDEIVIARHGRPVARLVAIEDDQPERKPGLLKGQIEIADDFDAPLPDEILKAFYSSPIEPGTTKSRK